MPDLINLTLSVTVDGDDAAIAAASVLTTAMVRVLDNVPNVQGASVTVYRDDFLGAEAEAKSGEIVFHPAEAPGSAAGKVHIAVADADLAADALREIRGQGR